MDWHIKGIPIDSIPDGKYGFVYCITNKYNKRKYIGKKFFYASKTYQLKGKKRRKKVESNWKNYWGSNQNLQDDIKEFGKENFDREILYLCKTKTECAYLETKTIINSCALLLDSYYNDWVSCKITRKHLHAIRDHDQLHERGN